MMGWWIAFVFVMWISVSVLIGLVWVRFKTSDSKK